MELFQIMNRRFSGDDFKNAKFYNYDLYDDDKNFIVPLKRTDNYIFDDYNYNLLSKPVLLHRTDLREDYLK